ncbi:MAG: hypothetical protein DRG82_15445 [Deltaproteobacteria bacterium]|nr:MAG: hypothetical protein DRG82_15445 [Deltaproteobacteria bacterium]
MLEKNLDIPYPDQSSAENSKLIIHLGLPEESPALKKVVPRIIKLVSNGAKSVAPVKARPRTHWQASITSRVQCQQSKIGNESVKKQDYKKIRQELT